MNILYICNYNEDNKSSTFKDIREVFSNDKVFYLSYPREDVAESIDIIQRFIKTNDISVVIAHSYSAFIALFLRNIIKILVNPCMKPGEELCKIGATEELVEDNKMFEMRLKDIPFEDSLTTLGLFSDHDEVFGTKYRDMFRNYGYSMDIKECGHVPARDMLEKELKPIIPGFIEAAANRWLND